MIGWPLKGARATLLLVVADLIHKPPASVSLHAEACSRRIGGTF
ncbi:MAG: hypothetical protein PVF37_02465 [Desulfobacterales bacterium]